MPKGTWGYDVNGNQVNQTNSATSIWALMLGALQGIGGGTPGPQPAAGSTSFVPAQGTPQQAAIAASANNTIPLGARNWWYSILTGTGTVTINGVAITFTAPYTFFSPGTLAGNTVNVAAASASSAAIGWET